MGVAVVVGGPQGAGPRIAAPAAIRAGRALTDLGCESVRPAGRVCLVGDAELLPAIVARRMSAETSAADLKDARERPADSMTASR